MATGGSKYTLFKDMEQVKLMWNLRIKIDVWSQGMDDARAREESPAPHG